MGKDDKEQFLDLLKTFNPIFANPFLIKDATFKERVFFKYSLEVKNDLEKLLTLSEGEIENKLFSYFKKEANFPRFYTAYPDSDLVKLLCVFAEKLCEHHNFFLKNGEKPWAPLELLMPKLQLESNVLGFPHLGVFEKAQWNLNKEEECSELEKVLSSNGLPRREEELGLTEEEDKQLNDYTQRTQLLVWYKTSKQRPDPKRIETIQSELSQLSLSKNLALALEKQMQIKRLKRLACLKGERKAFFAEEQRLSLGQVKEYGPYLLPILDLKTVLKTHILSAQNDSLIPISVLFTKTLPQRPYQNPLCFSFSEEDREDEDLRLRQHSPETLALYEAEQRLLTLQQDKNNLLGQLTDLCKHLRSYDAKEGVGQEDNAGGGAYEPIRKFAEYYECLGYQLRKHDPLQDLAEGFIDIDLALNPKALVFKIKYSLKFGERLISGLIDNDFLPELTQIILQKIKQNEDLIKKGKSPYLIDAAFILEEVFDLKDKIVELVLQNHPGLKEEKSKIPKPLRIEIERLLNLSKDPKTNVSATRNMDTCIATRREQLEKIMRGDEKYLFSISCSKNQQEALLDEAIKDFSNTEKVLREQVKTNHYSGQDRLVLSQELLKRLDLKLRFKRYADLENLMELSAEEIKTLGALKNGTKILVDLIPSLEKLVLFIHDYPSVKLAAFLELTESHLLHRFAKSAQDAKAILSTLEGDKFRLLARKFYNYSPTIGAQLLFALVDEPRQLRELLLLIPLTERLQAVKRKCNFGRSLLHRADNEEALKIILEVYPEELQLKALEEKDPSERMVLHTVAHNPAALKIILDLYPLKRLLEAVKQRDVYGCTVLFYACKHPESLKIILGLFPPKQQLDLVKEMDFSHNTILHKVSQASESLKIILALYPKEERLEALKKRNKWRETVLQKVGDQLESFKIILDLYPKEERLTAIKEKNIQGNTLLQKVCQDAQLLKNVLDLYPIGQRLEAVREKNKNGNTILHEVAQRPELLKIILDALPAEVVLDAVHEKNSWGYSILYKAMDNLISLKMILSLYSIEQRLEVVKEGILNSGNTLLHEFSNLPDSLKLTLELLTPKQRLEAIKLKNNEGNTLLHLIAHHSELLKTILDLYPPQERLQVIKDKDNEGNTVIHSVAANPELLKIILDSLRPEERLELLHLKDGDGRTVLFEAAEHPESLQIILSLYSKEQRLKAVEEKDCYNYMVLHTAAKNSQSLQMILDLYPPKQRLEAVKKRELYGCTVFHHAATEIESLKVILAALTPEQRFEALQEKDGVGHNPLHHAIEKPAFLKIILTALPQEQRLNAVKIKNESGHIIIYKVAKNRESLAVLLDALDSEQRLEALKLKSGEGYSLLSEACEHSKALKIILDAISSKERLMLFKEKDNFGLSLFYKAVAKKPKLLMLILDNLSSEQCLILLKERRPDGLTMLQKLLSQPDLLKKVLLGLVPEQRLELAMEPDSIGNTMLHHLLEQPEWIKDILALLPPMRRFEVITKKTIFIDSVLSILSKKNINSLQAIFKNFPCALLLQQEVVTSIKKYFPYQQNKNFLEDLYLGLLDESFNQFKSAVNKSNYMRDFALRDKINQLSKAIERVKFALCNCSLIDSADLALLQAEKMDTAIETLSQILPIDQLVNIFPSNKSSKIFENFFEKFGLGASSFQFTPNK